MTSLILVTGGTGTLGVRWWRTNKATAGEDPRGGQRHRCPHHRTWSTSRSSGPVRRSAIPGPSLECERAVAGLPWTMPRATQFYDLIYKGARALARLPVVPVPALGVRDPAGSTPARWRPGSLMFRRAGRAGCPTWAARRPSASPGRRAPTTGAARSCRDGWALSVPRLPSPEQAAAPGYAAGDGRWGMNSWLTSSFDLREEPQAAGACMT